MKPPHEALGPFIQAHMAQNVRKKILSVNIVGSDVMNTAYNLTIVQYIFIALIFGYAAFVVSNVRDIWHLEKMFSNNYVISFVFLVCLSYLIVVSYYIILW